MLLSYRFKKRKTSSSPTGYNTRHGGRTPNIRYITTHFENNRGKNPIQAQSTSICLMHIKSYLIFKTVVKPMTKKQKA